MKKLLILLSFLILTSVAHSAINKNDPNLPNVVSNWNKQFEGTQKNISLASKLASGKMDTMVNQINGSSQVSNRIKDSIADSETGRKVNVTAKVTQTANKAKVAEALAERFKNAGKYAKNLGKASLPAFVGTAAFHGLMNGVDYVMDPENNTIQKPNPELETETTVQPWHQYRFYVTRTQQYVASIAALQKITDASYYESTWTNCALSSGNIVNCDVKNDVSGATANLSAGYRDANPAYNPNAVNPSKPTLPASDQDIVNALKKALESNNPALAASIAEAIKAAYTPDNSLGQSLVDIPANGTAMDATDSAVDAVRKAGKSTGEEPTSGGKPGYYKITDGDKTIEGYVYPTDGTASGTSDSNTVTNPDGSTTTTGTTATNWPNFCDWAGVVCEFIDWVKEDPEVEDELELPEEELEKQEIDKDLLNVSGHSCPNALQINFKDLPFNMTFNKSIDIQPFCNTIEPLKYVLQLITICLCAFMFLRL